MENDKNGNVFLLNVTMKHFIQSINQWARELKMRKMKSWALELKLTKREMYP
jgi:hypothetical protein